MSYVLWGFHLRYVGPDGFIKPIKLTAGDMRKVKAEQRERERQGGWTLSVYRQGVAPVGLRILCEAAQLTT